MVPVCLPDLSEADPVATELSPTERAMKLLGYGDDPKGWPGGIDWIGRLVDEVEAATSRNRVVEADNTKLKVCCQRLQEDLSEARTALARNLGII